MSSPELATTLRRCCASHLLDLVSRNVRIGDISTARRLLKDKRTELKPVRRVYWMTRTALAAFAA